jgi:dCMP deaminase
MEVARLTGRLSYSKKLQVGAVLSRGKRIISCGYNGTPPGADNTCEDLIDGKLITRPEVSHAERNCIENAARNGIKLEGSVMYVNVAPCIECAKSIMNAGIQKVIFENEYKNTDGIDFLRNHGVPIEQLS